MTRRATRLFERKRIQMAAIGVHESEVLHVRIVDSVSALSDKVLQFARAGRGRGGDVQAIEFAVVSQFPRKSCGKR